MEHTTKTGLYLWLFKVTLIFMCERLTKLENGHQKISYHRDIIRMIRKGDFTYYTEIINTGTCIWTILNVDIDL